MGAKIKHFLQRRFPRQFSFLQARLAMGMQFVSALASTAAVSILFAVMSCILLWKRLWYWLLGLVLVVASGMLLNVLLNPGCAEQDVSGGALLKRCTGGDGSGNGLARALPDYGGNIAPLPRLIIVRWPTMS